MNKWSDRAREIVGIVFDEALVAVAQASETVQGGFRVSIGQLIAALSRLRYE